MTLTNKNNCSSMYINDETNIFIYCLSFLGK